MAESEALEVWTIATFNVVIFSLVGVLGGHLSGVLSDILSGLGTVPGLLVFGYLWAVGLLATRWAITPGGLDRIDRGEISALLVRGALAGGLIGSLFVIGISLGAGLIQVFQGGIELLSVGIIVGFGGTISAIGGGIIGVLFVLLDAGLYRTVSMIQHWSTA